MRTCKFHKNHLNVDPARLRYDIFRINLEIRWLSIRTILDAVLIIVEVVDLEIFSELKTLPAPIFCIEKDYSEYIEVEDYVSINLSSLK
jgi:hypothetical protein